MVRMQPFLAALGSNASVQPVRHFQDLVLHKLLFTTERIDKNCPCPLSSPSLPRALLSLKICVSHQEGLKSWGSLYHPGCRIERHYFSCHVMSTGCGFHSSQQGIAHCCFSYIAVTPDIECRIVVMSMLY